MSGFPYSGTALVTGAGSGIGRALAHGLAERGMDLALADISEERLEEVAEELRSNRNKVTTHVLDVADKDAVAALPDAVRRVHDRVSLLFNNAGVALGGNFEEVAEEDFDWLVAINFSGVVRMTRAFLPLLREAPKARLVNVSSIYGVIAPAGQTAYSASKFAVRGFSEALRHELDGSNVGVTVVHPGGIATNIAKDARVNAEATDAEIEKRRAQADKFLRMPPPKAAGIILRAVEKDAPRVLVGSDARIAEMLQRLLPGRYWNVLGRRATG